MMLEFLGQEFSICKLRSTEGLDVNRRFTFIGITDGEVSLVCPTRDVPSDTLERDDGWRMFRITGQLDLSMIGVLSKITGILAENDVGVFVVSTFNTDYVMVRKENVEKTMEYLSDAKYGWTRWPHIHVFLSSETVQRHYILL